MSLGEGYDITGMYGGWHCEAGEEKDIPDAENYVAGDVRKFAFRDPRRGDDVMGVQYLPSMIRCPNVVSIAHLPLILTIFPVNLFFHAEYFIYLFILLYYIRCRKKFVAFFPLDGIKKTPNFFVHLICIIINFI